MLPTVVFTETLIIIVATREVGQSHLLVSERSVAVVIIDEEVEVLVII